MLHLYHLTNKLLQSFTTILLYNDLLKIYMNFLTNISALFLKCFISKMLWGIKLDMRFLRVFDYVFYISVFNTLISKTISVSDKKIPMTLCELFKAYPVWMTMRHKLSKCWNSQLSIFHEMLPENHAKLKSYGWRHYYLEGSK